MGNNISGYEENFDSDSNHDDDNNLTDLPHYIIHFHSIDNIPASEFTSECRPYIKAYIGLSTIECQSIVVTTPMKLPGNAVWHSYRDFGINPSEGSSLIIEVINGNSKAIEPDILGSVEIPISEFTDESLKSYPMQLPQNKLLNRDIKNFTINLRRVFINRDPPVLKTIFLVRHGESKWNKAQASVNIGGLLDRDHALTEDGCFQAKDLNGRWKHTVRMYELQDRPSEDFESNEPFINIDSTTENEGLIAYDNDDEIQQEPLLDFDLELSTSQDNSTTANSTRLDSDIDISLNNFIVQTNSNDILKLRLVDNNESYSPNDKACFSPTMTSGTTHLFEELNIDPSIEKTYYNFDDSNRGSFSGSRSSDKLNNDDDDDSNVKNYRNSKHNIRKFITRSIRYNTVEEGIEARRKEYIKLFMSADAVFSSPLTRAIETAFLCLDGHPAMEKRGLTLYSVIREVKRLGGLDSVGIVYGNEIEERVRSELTAVIGKYRTDETMIESLNHNDCNQPWWTSITSYESDEEQLERMLEFISFIRYSESSIPIFVGHSLFFKLFYKSRISSTLRKYRTELASNLKKYRLSNATILACTIEFIDNVNNTGRCEASILDADLIFGGGFHGTNFNDDEDDDNGTPTVSKLLEKTASFRFGHSNGHDSQSSSLGSNASSHISRVGRKSINDIKNITHKILDSFQNLR